jgi:DNA-binding transcriptional ArsR family regulator
MHALDVLGDPVRRRILELLLAWGESPAGAITEVIRAEAGISQPAVSQHLRVLREQGFVVVRQEGTRRLYTLHPDAFASVEAWLAPFREPWSASLSALGTEIARGKRQRREVARSAGAESPHRKEFA